MYAHRGCTSILLRSSAIGRIIGSSIDSRRGTVVRDGEVRNGVRFARPAHIPLVRDAGPSSVDLIKDALRWILVIANNVKVVPVCSDGVVRDMSARYRSGLVLRAGIRDGKETVRADESVCIRLSVHLHGEW